jgi:putative transposase
VKYRFMQQQRGRWPLSWMCSAFGVSRSGFYAFCLRPPSPRLRANAALTAQLRMLFADSKRNCGSPRLHNKLAGLGIRCSRKRVARLMGMADLRVRPRRRFVVTTQNTGGAAAPNLLDRNFAPGGEEAWAADLTYIDTAEGWLYLAVVLSIRSRRVLGWAMGQNCNTALCLEALRMAAQKRKPAAGTLHHSDRGSTYTALEYQQALEEYGLRASMSRRGDCYDNAVVESFFATLKRELLKGRRVASRALAQQLINAFIEDYNRERMHSSLGYLSPEQFEKQYPVLN